MDGRLGDVYVDVFGKQLAPTEIFALGVSKSQAIQVGGATSMLGTPTDKQYFECHFVRLADDEDPVHDVAPVTYTDPRRRKAHRAPEWRLNYSKHQRAMALAKPGDLCWLARKRSDPSRLLLAMAPADSLVAARLDRVMGTELLTNRGLVRWEEPISREDFVDGALDAPGASNIDAADADLLAELDVPVSTPHADLFPLLLSALSGKAVSDKSGMVSIEVFCSAVRALVTDVDGRDGDAAIELWMAVSEELFFLYERTILQRRIDDAFANRASIELDVFMELAKSALNSRKTRAGGTLESHLAAMFRANDIAFERVHRPLDTDHTKPDFVMPNKQLFLDDGFPDELLTVVGSKTTLRERWLQVQAEGTRVPVKHLATLDRDIPGATLTAMGYAAVVPVMPRSIRDQSYRLWRADIWTFADLLAMLGKRQALTIAQGVALDGISV